MQRREHQVAGLRGLDGNLRGLEVANFADHDDVRILAKECPERGGEVEPGLVVDVDLIDAGKLDFGGILGGRDVDAGLVQDVEAAVHRYGLA